MSIQAQIEHYTQLAHAALAHYPLTIKTVTYITQRYNVIFRIDAAEGTFALRISANNHRMPLQVRSEMQWLESICHETDLRVACPLRTQDNHLMLYLRTDHFPEGRSIVVMQWLEGVPLKERKTVANIRQLGSVIARIHQQSVSYQAPDDFMTFDDFSISEFGNLDYIYQPHPLLTAEQQTLLQAAITRIQAQFAQWRDDAPRLYLIHHDLQLTNTMIHNGEIGVIDFDDCRWGLLLQDLLPAWHLLMHDEALATALLDGYSDIRPLPCTYADLNLAVMHRALWGLTFLMHHRHDALGDDFMRNYIAQIETVVRANFV